jgi:hypothetical protein
MVGTKIDIPDALKLSYDTVLFKEAENISRKILETVATHGHSTSFGNVLVGFGSLSFFGDALVGFVMGLLP